MLPVGSSASRRITAAMVSATSTNHPLRLVMEEETPVRKFPFGLTGTAGSIREAGRSVETSRAGPDGKDSPDDAMAATSWIAKAPALRAQHEDDGDKYRCRQAIPCE